MNDKARETISKKQEKNKEAVLEMLKKTPIVQVVCEKTGVSRATFYRWRQEDSSFDEQVNQALDLGIGIINDMAESQLISAIKDKNMTAIIYWLKNRHKSYTTKIEVTTNSKSYQLTPEQEAMVKKALEYASFNGDSTPDIDKNEKQLPKL